LPILSKHPHIVENMPHNLEPLPTFGEVLAHLHYLEPTISIPRWVKGWKCSNQIKREATEIIQAICYFEKHGLDEWLVYQLDPAYEDGLLRIMRNLSHTQAVKAHDLTVTRQQLVIQS